MGWGGQRKVDTVVDIYIYIYINMVVSVLCMCLIVFFLNKKEKESVTLNQTNKQSINQSITKLK